MQGMANTFIVGVDQDDQDLFKDTMLRSPLEEPVRVRSQHLAADRERYARRLLERRLPRHLHWLIDRPRALKLAFRLWPRWRPTFTIVRLSVPTTAATATDMASRWEDEMRAHGNAVSDSGLIFTYTDPSGLPAEVYGG